MSGGGKGGSTTQKQEIPDWAKEPTIRNIALVFISLTLRKGFIYTTTKPTLKF